MFAEYVIIVFFRRYLSKFTLQYNNMIVYAHIDDERHDIVDLVTVFQLTWSTRNISYFSYAVSLN